jgi:ubiquinone/menaquinone biosynthesis C-methylase UbiE
MLRRASKKARKNSRLAEWVQAETAFVPFRDETFDLVFQMGGLQFVSDPFKAVSEMVRVSKPGAEIHIIDELRGGSLTLSRMPAHQKYSGRDSVVAGMKRLVPHSMTNINSEVIPETDFYVLHFCKPPIPSKSVQTK